jgi:hypothetical protein
MDDMHWQASWNSDVGCKGQQMQEDQTASYMQIAKGDPAALWLGVATSLGELGRMLQLTSGCIWPHKRPQLLAAVTKHNTTTHDAHKPRAVQRYHSTASATPQLQQAVCCGAHTTNQQFRTLLTLDLHKGLAEAAPHPYTH